MNYKFKTFLPIIMSVLLFIFASPCLAQLPIKVTVNNNTQNYVITIGSDSGFSPGSFSANFSILKPGESGIVTIMPAQSGLLGVLAIGIKTMKYVITLGADVNLGFSYNSQLVSQIIYSEKTKGKVFIKIEGLTPRWLPGQNITINVTDLISNQ